MEIMDRIKLPLYAILTVAAGSLTYTALTVSAATSATLSGIGTVLAAIMTLTYWRRR